MTLNSLLQKHIDSHQTNNKDWPPSARFALHYRMSTWPCGWAKESETQFFETRDQLDSKVVGLHKFAELEDNYVAYAAYEWDLGPQPLDSLQYNEGNLH